MSSPLPMCPRRLIAIVAVGASSVVGAGAIAQPAIAVTKPPKAVQTKAAQVASAPTTFPKLKVLDLATGKTIDLASLNVSAKPQLIWFWAPT